MLTCDPQAYHEYFSALAGVSGTLWAIALVIVTVVVARPATGREFGRLSRLKVHAEFLAATRDVNPKVRTLLRHSRSIYFQAWFISEALPIAVFFQVAIMLSLAGLLPLRDYTLLWAVPLVNYLPFHWLLRRALENSRKAEAARVQVDAGPASQELSDKERFSNRRKYLAPALLLLAGTAVLILWPRIDMIATVAAGALLTGLVYGLNAASNLTAAMEH